MKKTVKKRYNTANDIRDAIDRYKDKAKKLRDRAASMDFITDQMVKGAAPASNTISYRRNISDKLRESAARIEERQLTKLKNKLSEWQTDTMRAIIPDGDKSVPVK